MSYKLHVGELKPIQWFPNPQPPEPPEPPSTSPVNLTGLTITMNWKDAEAGAHSAAMTVADDGLSASYTTVAGDLPNPGVYQFQFLAASGSGPPLIESDIVHETVGAVLT